MWNYATPGIGHNNSPPERKVIVPRWYQDAAVDALFRYFDAMAGQEGNPLVCMPTGTGKSLVIALFIKRAFQLYPYSRMMMITHVKELVSQDMKALLSVWENAPAGIYSDGLKKYQTGFPITMGTVGSVIGKVHVFGHIDILFIDEAHLVSPSETTMYRKIIELLKLYNPWLKVVGLTATPYRQGLGYLTDNGGIFTHVAYDITNVEGFARLIAEGHIVPLFPKRTKLQIDVSKVRIQGGEYNQSDLAEATDQERITYAALQELVAWGYDRHCWLIFGTSVEHTEHIAAALQAFNVPATAIHSKLEPGQRDKRMEQWKAGEFRCAVNQNILTTGVDHPPIDLIGILRKTLSTSLWVQMLGRGTRPCEETGKSNCLVLDFADNSSQLGPINDPVIPKRKGPGSGDAPIKICAKCDGYNHPRVTHCWQCGNEFSFETKFSESASEGELLRDNAPVTEIFDVQQVLYDKHQKEGSPPCLRVGYRCGLRMVNEFVFFEHAHVPYLVKRADQWWAQRSELPTPATVNEALRHFRTLRAPRKIAVWTNNKFPTVTGVEF